MSKSRHFVVPLLLACLILPFLIPVVGQQQVRPFDDGEHQGRFPERRAERRGLEPLAELEPRVLMARQEHLVRREPQGVQDPQDLLEGQDKLALMVK